MMRLPYFSVSLILLLATTGAAPPSSDADVGTFVRALWLIQRYGTAEAANPRNDLRTKSVLSKALGKDGVLTSTGVSGLMDPETFAKLAGPDARLDPSEVSRALESDTPETRRRLLPGVAAHARYLSTSFDLIDDRHREAGDQLADWVVAHYRPGRPLDIIFVCTGNSRRSILGAILGNIAADYHGLPEVRCHSGGTAPTAFNPRTVATLREIGVEIDPTGKEAPRGEPATANPISRVRWGRPGDTDGPAMEATEFSKRYDDPSNPSDGFAALMVCSEADAACPFVKGAALRVSMPYLDPKLYDGSAFETAKYAERRDDMGRLMMAVMSQARRRLDAAGKRP